MILICYSLMVLYMLMGLDDKLNMYLQNIDGDKIKKAAIFSSTWFSKHSIDLIRKKLEEKGIKVIAESFYVKGKPSEEKLKEVELFAKKYI